MARRYSPPDGRIVQTFTFAPDPTPEQAAQVARFFGTRRTVFNWTPAQLKADLDLCDVTGESRGRASFYGMRTRWNAGKDDVCVDRETGNVWWPEVSKDVFADGVRGGVTANSAWLFGFVEKFTGQTLTPIRLLGGGAQSTLWCQLYADVLDRPVEQVREPLLAQLRGAALLASIALANRTLGESIPAGTMYQPSAASAFYRERAGELESLYRRDRAWSRANVRRSHAR